MLSEGCRTEYCPGVVWRATVLEPSQTKNGFCRISSSSKQSYCPVRDGPSGVGYKIQHVRWSLRLPFCCTILEGDADICSVANGAEPQKGRKSRQTGRFMSSGWTCSGPPPRASSHGCVCVCMIEDRVSRSYRISRKKTLAIVRHAKRNACWCTRCTPGILHAGNHIRSDDSRIRTAQKVRKIHSIRK
jgi:hypothetical protein